MYQRIKYYLDLKLLHLEKIHYMKECEKSKPLSMIEKGLNILIRYSYLHGHSTANDINCVAEDCRREIKILKRQIVELVEGSEKEKLNDARRHRND